ncbi:MAG: thiamine-phosphate kinase [Dehalogenimonas sp.]|uniref:Thiamine-monophosphate kinase n=1 Tax=Candidatus Dehalogenimonas loeffleri TaxID=3127115 RepID=A0ABZ2J910_9CHLR|nr:thiamine-phosphate kinase [Dehalogenimonas sp.]
MTEFELIDRITTEINRIPPVGSELPFIGIGDDTAVFKSLRGYQLATMDALVEGVHFKKQYLDWTCLGWKALAVNLSDIAAMGGAPVYALVSLGLPGDVAVEDVVTMYRGMADLAAQNGTVIAGGNISRAGELSVHVAVTGTVQSKSRVLLRSKARTGDLIAVTGSLGAAAAGLKLLEGTLKADVKEADELIAAFWRPEPRLTIGRQLVAHGVKCAIDISDGLLADLGHLLQAGNVGARLEAARIPVHPAVAAVGGDKALELAISGGEDYELLFTAHPAVMGRVVAAAECKVTVIGVVTRDAGCLDFLEADGRAAALNNRGWRHF